MKKNLCHSEPKAKNPRGSFACAQDDNKSFRTSYWRSVWLQFRRSRMNFAALIFVVAMLFVAIFSSWISPYAPDAYDLDQILQSPNIMHWLGTDDLGRDVLSRMIHGAKVSLSVGFVAVSIYVAIGILIGAIAGFYGGWIDLAISRVIEVMMCFPTFFLILAVLAFVGPSIYNIMIVIGVTQWTGIARLVRGEILKLKNQGFVLAAKQAGANHWRLIVKHLLPNAVAPVLVSASFGVASAILTESALSFLGFGVPPQVPSWGSILFQAQSFMETAWWLTLAPGLAIFITITAYNLVGEGLRDAIDPRLNQI